MEKKNIDWENLDFGYRQTDKRFVANYKDGAWDEGTLTEDANIVLNECAGVLQYAQTVFEGLKAYTTVDGKVVIFRPDLNASRMADSARRLEMPVYPEDKFIEAVEKTVKANMAYVPPYGTGATLYIRPYMFGSSPVIGVKPAQEYQFRVLTTPVGPYFKGGVKPLTIRVTDFDRAAPHGTGHIKAGLNYAMSLHAIVTAFTAIWATVSSPAMWRAPIPVRSRIQASLVSTIFSRSSFFHIVSGTYEPVPAILPFFTLLSSCLFHSQTFFFSNVLIFKVYHQNSFCQPFFIAFSISHFYNETMFGIFSKLFFRILLF